MKSDPIFVLRKLKYPFWPTTKKHRLGVILILQVTRLLTWSWFPSRGSDLLTIQILGSVARNIGSTVTKLSHLELISKNQASSNIRGTCTITKCELQRKNFFFNNTPFYKHYFPTPIIHILTCQLIVRKLFSHRKHFFPWRGIKWCESTWIKRRIKLHSFSVGSQPLIVK